MLCQQLVYRHTISVLDQPPPWVSRPWQWLSPLNLRKLIYQATLSYNVVYFYIQPEPKNEANAQFCLYLSNVLTKSNNFFGTPKRQLMTNSAMQKLNNNIYCGAQLKWIQTICFCSIYGAAINTICNPQSAKSPIMPLSSLRCGQQTVQTWTW